MYTLATPNRPRLPVESFVKPSPTPPPTGQPIPLDHVQQEWIAEQISQVIVIAEHLGIGPDDADTPDLLDTIVGWWHDQPPAKRPDVGEMINALGAGLGDFLVFQLNVDWRAVQVGEGMTLRLIPTDGHTKLAISPFDEVAKRFAKSPEGFVVHYLESLFKTLPEELFRDDDGDDEGGDDESER